MKKTIILTTIFLLSFITLYLVKYVLDYHPYKSGDDFGYNLGLIGGLGMLSLLIYSIRKRLPWLNWAGSLPSWFNYHMIIGIIAPVLILFHSNFQTKSLNATVAYYCMIIVAISGIVGRFIYRHTHKTMSDKIITSEEAQKMVNESVAEMRKDFDRFPSLEQKLSEYKDYAFSDIPEFHKRIYRFLTLRFKGNALNLKLRSRMKKIYNELRKDGKMTDKEALESYYLHKNSIIDFVDNICKASQIKIWEYLFSFWHLFHLPFMYLLLISGIVHVVAVHMF